MTTSGSTDFELNVADYVEEAFERCGLEVRTGYDLRTARRSLNLLFAADIIDLEVCGSTWGLNAFSSMSAKVWVT